MNTGAFLVAMKLAANKAVAMFLTAYAAIGAVISMSWLPDDPVSALILGLVGALLQLSVPWVINSPERPGKVQAVLIVVTGAAIAVFFNGTQIPFLPSIVDREALWRVNTLMLAFIGLGVPLYFIGLWKAFSNKAQA